MADVRRAESADTPITSIDTANHDIPSPNQSTVPVSNDIKNPSILSNGKPLTALQQHILFWDPDNDSILWPSDIYNGFRALGFNIPFSILALLIPVYFSYPTTLGHSWFPDPYFRIYLNSIHKAKHGSDTGIYDLDGNFRNDRFEEMWERFDIHGAGGLGVMDLWRLLAKDRVAADPAGWTFAFMEWGTTWLLLQRNGRVWREDLKGIYDGSLFWTLQEENKKKGGTGRGFGVLEGLKVVKRLGEAYLVGDRYYELKL